MVRRRPGGRPRRGDGLGDDCGRVSAVAELGPGQDRQGQRGESGSIPPPIDARDIRTVEELLGHRDVTTAQISTHVLNRETSGVKSPTDTILGV